MNDDMNDDMNRMEYENEDENGSYCCLYISIDCILMLFSMNFVRIL